MRYTVNKSLLALAVSGVLISPAVNATNGYNAHGYSTKEKGLAGAGTAYSQDAMAAATNPAGMAFVGGRLDLGAAVFSPSPRSYTVTGTPVAPGPMAPFGSAINAEMGDKVESDNDIFVIPHVGYNWQMDADTAIGVSIYGNGGMNSEYPTKDTPGDAGTFGTGTAGVNLEQGFLNFSFAKKLNDKHAFGASLIVVAQRFSAQGLEAFGPFSEDPGNLSGDKHSYSYGLGLKVGYQGEVVEGMRVGLSYQPKINMQEFDEYSGLFAEGGDFDVPSTINVGASFDVGKSGVIVADAQYIMYSDVKSVNNSIDKLFSSCIPAGFGPSPTASGSGCLGASNGAGFGWDDVTIYKIGYQVDVGSNTYRVGYSHADQPISESETFFNILAPAVIKDHITAGMTIKIGANQEFNFSGMYAPNHSVKGPNPIDGGSTQIEIEMEQWEVQAGWAWRY